MVALYPSMPDPKNISPGEKHSTTTAAADNSTSPATELEKPTNTELQTAAAAQVLEWYPRKNGVGREYPDKTRAAVLALRDSGMTVLEISTSTDIPERTVSQWTCKGSPLRKKHVPTDVCAAAKEDLAVLCERMARKMLGHVDGMSQDRLEKASLSQISTAAGIFIDKKVILERGSLNPDADGKHNIFIQMIQRIEGVEAT